MPKFYNLPNWLNFTAILKIFFNQVFNIYEFCFGRFDYA